MATSRVVTDEEVLKLPKTARSIVGGEVRFVMGASLEHERIVVRLTNRLGAFVEARQLGAVLGSNVMYRFASGNMYEPDASFIAAERLVGLPRDEGTTKIPPDLAVEVVSQEQPGEVAEKLYEYTRAGIRLVWIVDPHHKTAIVAHGGRLRSIGPDGQLEGFDVLPGFALPLADLF